VPAHDDEEGEKVNTRKRLAALRSAARLATDPQAAAAVPANPACVIGSGQHCEHPLVDAELNRRLAEYESRVRARFAAIKPFLRQLAAHQHDEDFVWQAQELARERMGFDLPPQRLEHSWATGLDLRALHAECIIRTIGQCVEGAERDQQPWRERMAIDDAFLHACGFHTVDISPCADGRLQGLLPFILRIAPSRNVFSKAYAGVMFDIEGDLADWTMRELDRLSGGMPGREAANYLKIAVYHYSSSQPGEQGCAAHGSNDVVAVQAALSRLEELRLAIENSYGLGAAPAILAIGVDTDIDAIRIHVPAADGSLAAARHVDGAALYRQTLTLSAEKARQRIAEAVAAAGEADVGMQALIARLIEANFSQIEYVIHHHQGRYAVIGHDENFICVGEAVAELQLRNMYYYAHLDTIEEGARDMDVGIRIFTGLNLERGLAAPVLIHFRYDSRVPGSRQRAVARCQRVRDAIHDRYSALAASGQIHTALAVSDLWGQEHVALIDTATVGAGH